MNFNNFIHIYIYIYILGIKLPFSISLDSNALAFVLAVAFFDWVPCTIHRIGKYRKM